MTRAMRDPGLRSLGFDGVLEIFRQGRLPVSAADLVDEVFGPSGRRGSLVISGASGTVGAGKAMQLGSRLHQYGVKVVALDFPGAPDGIGRQMPGLVGAFGREEANRIMANVIRMHTDGRSLPAELTAFQPRFLLEAIPEILEAKRAHYEMFRQAFPGIQIRSVTSGFPSSVLGVPIAHPAFPHEINKVFETVEPEPSAVTRLLWALGLIPIPVSDRWSFVLDLLFCGLTHAGLRYHEARNMPFWKIDKWVRRLLGPNPFRAHDAIGAKGATFLTWSCLRDLGEQYGDLFRPTATLEERKESGVNWYPPDHFRPLVDWKLEDWEVRDLEERILGPMLQMTSLLVHERRASLPFANAIGELCAQFRRGMPAVARGLGPDECRRIVEAYHRTHPEAAPGALPCSAALSGPAAAKRTEHPEAAADKRTGGAAPGGPAGSKKAGHPEATEGASPDRAAQSESIAANSTWFPEAFDAMDGPEWRQLYVNAEHDGAVGVITIGRESYNRDVDAELNRALDWLKAEGISRAIVTGDFHLATQLVGADTSEFFPALTAIDDGLRISTGWSRTARRLHDEFAVSVGLVNGKRALGGMLELLLHCHYLIALDTAELGMPEVTLPVVPGMEGCHWPFRKARPEDRPKLVRFLLEGRPVKAGDAVGWLADFAAPLEPALRMAWSVATGGDQGLPLRRVDREPLAGVAADAGILPPAGPGIEAARHAILATIRDSCRALLSEALAVQARHCAEFMVSAACREGRIGDEAARTQAA